LAPLPNDDVEDEIDEEDERDEVDATAAADNKEDGK
jgi:hypothetical protein